MFLYLLRQQQKRENVQSLIFLLKGPCEGDSGGPLFQQETTEEGFTKSSLIGIVAGGLGCGINIPIWYTRVSEIHDKYLRSKSNFFNKHILLILK